jgi:hypothetical protein
MGWLRSFWQRVKKPLEVFGVIVVCALVIALIVVIVRVYVFHVDVPGLRGKNLWDWLQLLIIPAVLAVGGYLFNFATGRTEREIALDKQREDALQAYIDSMSELLLHEKLRMSGDDDEVRKIARVRTLTVLPRLDGRRKRSVLDFLHESGLIEQDKRIVNLDGADLSGIRLSFANLSKVNLSGAVLVGANISRANLSEANLNRAVLAEAILKNTNLSKANLVGAFMTYADLSGANLSETDLSGAKVTMEQLNNARLLKGAILPSGTEHP